MEYSNFGYSAPSFPEQEKMEKVSEEVWTKLESLDMNNHDHVKAFLHQILAMDRRSRLSEQNEEEGNTPELASPEQLAEDGEREEDIADQSRPMSNKSVDESGAE